MLFKSEIRPEEDGMLTKIKDGILLKLNQGFGEQYRVYVDKPEQDFIKPCFWVKVTQSINTQKSPRKYKRESSIDIQYFPNLDAGNAQVYEVVEKLFEILEYIPFENELLRASDMKFQLVDNEFHFSIHYNVFLLRMSEAQEYMEDLTVDMEVNNNDK